MFVPLERGPERYSPGDCRSRSGRADRGAAEGGAGCKTVGVVMALES
jgi:hypothetical protein